MEKTLAEAATKGGETAEMLKHIGLNAKDLAHAPDKLNQLADATAKMADPTQRAALAFAIFGKEGAGMIPTLAKGSKGIEDLSAEAEKFHLVLTNMDLHKLTDTEDAIKKLSAQGQGAINELSVAIAPSIKRLAEWASENEEAARQAATLGATVGATALAMGTMGGLMGGVAGAVGLFAAAAIHASEANLSWAESCYDVVRGLGLLHNGTQDQAVAMKKFADAGNASVGLLFEAQHAKTLDDKIDKAQEYLAALKDQYAAAKQLRDLAENNGNARDVGYDEKLIEGLNAKIKAAKDGLKQLETEKFKITAPDLSPLFKAQDEIKALTDKLNFDIGTFGMDESGKKILEIMWKVGDVPPALQATIDKAIEAREAFRGLQEHAKIADQLKKLEDAANAGSDFHKKMYGWEGATAGEIARRDAAEDQIKFNEKLEQQAERARQLAEKSLTPAQRYNEEMKNLHDLYQRHKIDLETLAKAQKELGNEFLKSQPHNDVRNEAIVRRFDFRMPNTNTSSSDPQQKLVDLQEKANQLSTQELQAALETKQLISQMKMPAVLSLT
jgi:hypothetical protein